jgi:hypothetical protein
MKCYADRPALRSRQILADVLVAAWVLLWLKIADVTHDAVLRLRAPGREMEQAGTSLAGHLGRAAEGAGALPLVGDSVASPLRSAAGGGDRLASAGRAQQDAVELLGNGVFLLLFAVPVVSVVAVWLVLRLRWARQASAAVRLLRDGGPLEVFAHRAVAHASLRELARQRKALTGWAEADPASVEELARWELRRLGLDLPDEKVSAARAPA